MGACLERALNRVGLLFKKRVLGKYVLHKITKFFVKFLPKLITKILLFYFANWRPVLTGHFNGHWHLFGPGRL